MKKQMGEQMEEQMELLQLKPRKETVHIENKEFCLKVDSRPSIPYTEIKHIIHTGTITNALQKIIDTSLEKTIRQVFPKYYTSFINANIQGNINIGINDDGIITGIPSKTLTRNFVLQCIQKACVHITSPIESIMKSIQFDVIPLAITPLITRSPIYQVGNTIHTKLAQYERERTFMETTNQQYNRDHKLWSEKKSRYNCKLQKLINDPSTRQELVAFIQTHKKYVPPKGIQKVQQIITRLKTTDIISVPCGIKLIPFKSTKTCPLMDNVFFWLLWFQNHHLTALQTVKPKKPKLLRLDHPWLILVRLRDMIPAFVKSNIQYYVIKIKIDMCRKNLTNTQQPICFYLSKKRKNFHVTKWSRKKRVLSDGQPACVDF